MDLDFENDLGCKGYSSHETFKILGDISGVDSFNFSISHFGDRANSIDVTFSANNCNYMHCDTLGLGVVTALSVEYSALFFTGLIKATFDTAKTLVGRSISTNDDLRAKASLAS